MILQLISAILHRAECWMSRNDGPLVVLNERSEERMTEVSRTPETAEVCMPNIHPVQAVALLLSRPVITPISCPAAA